MPRKPHHSKRTPNTTAQPPSEAGPVEMETARERKLRQKLHEVEKMLENQMLANDKQSRVLAHLQETVKSRCKANPQVMETALELGQKLRNAEMKLRDQKSENERQERLLGYLQEEVKERDWEITNLAKENNKLSENYDTLLEYGEELWKQREEEIDHKIKTGIRVVNRRFDELITEIEKLERISKQQQLLLQNKDETIDDLENQLKMQNQHPTDDPCVSKQLEFTQATNQELKDLLRQKNNDLETLCMELHQVSKAETELSQKLHQQQNRIQELEETLKNKDCALEMLHVEVNKAADDKNTIQHLKDQLGNLQEVVTQKDSQIEDLNQLNGQLLEDKMTIIEYGKKQWKSRAKKIAHKVSEGVAFVHDRFHGLNMEIEELQFFSQICYEELQEKKNTIKDLEDQLKVQAQRIEDDVLVLEELQLENATIKQLKDTLKQKNVDLEMFHVELSQVSEAKDALQRQKQELEVVLTQQALVVQHQETELKAKAKQLDTFSREQLDFQEKSEQQLQEKDKRVKELNTALQSCEAERSSVLHRCEELESRAEELQTTLDQKSKKKKKKGWFRKWFF